MGLPRPIYEILPFLYVIVGAFALTGIEPTFGRLSGFVLITAGIHIYRMRRAFRVGEKD